MYNYDGIRARERKSALNKASRKRWMIIKEKLENFANMTYEETRSVLRTYNDYYVFIEDKNGNRIFVDGKQGIGLEPTNSKNLVALDRILIYNSTIVRMVIQVWE